MNEKNTTNLQEQEVKQEDSIESTDFVESSNKWSWRSCFSVFLELVKTIIISLAIILPIRYFLIQPFMVEGASMQPNFHDRDYLIVNEILYRFKEPERGEVIVFKNPENTKQYFIKRVMATPGESIKIEDGSIYIKKLTDDTYNKVNEEEYLPKDLKTYGNSSEIALASDEYFVMGDNRGNSRDSRFFGPLKRNLIVGRVWLRGFPFDQISVFNFDNYNFFDNL